VHAFVISGLTDYCNGILASLPRCLLSQLQQVQNAAARLVLGLKPRGHIRPALFELHWLPVHLRIEYKLCLLMHSATVQCCPSYISDLVQIPPHHLVNEYYVRPLTVLHMQSHTDSYQVWGADVFSYRSDCMELSTI